MLYRNHGGYLCLVLLSLLVAAGISSPVQSCPIQTDRHPVAPNVHAFNDTVTGLVSATRDGDLYRFDVTLDTPYLFGAFYIFIRPEVLAGLTPEDIHAPEGWERFGIVDAKGYVGFETGNMSERNIVRAEDGFTIRLPGLSAVEGYGFHIREEGSETTYFATLVPEPGTLILFSSGFLLLLRKRKHPQGARTKGTVPVQPGSGLPV